MEMLRGLQEMGVPVPLRALAAAGGFNLDSLLINRDEDLILQKQITDYQNQVAKIKGAPPGGGDEGMGSFSGSRVLNGRKMPTLKDRDFGEASEIYTFDHGGQKKHVFNQTRANAKANEKLYKAMKSLDPKNPQTQHLHASTPTNKQAGPPNGWRGRR
jgi:hypothetical protein